MAVSFFAVKLTALPLRLAGKYLASWDKKVFQNERISFLARTWMKRRVRIETAGKTWCHRKLA
jgi:hypothetical protein